MHRFLRLPASSFISTAIIASFPSPKTALSATNLNLSKFYIYKEDFNEFKDLLAETITFIFNEKGEEVISERHQKDYKPPQKKENEKSSDEDSDLSDIEYDE